MEGVLAEAPTVVHAGAARAVALDIQAGSEARRRAQIAPRTQPLIPASARSRRETAFASLGFVFGMMASWYPESEP